MKLVAAVVIVVIIAAHARLNAVVLGQPVSIPWLGVVVAVAALGLAVAVLVLVRAIVREGMRLRWVSHLGTAT